MPTYTYLDDIKDDIGDDENKGVLHGDASMIITLHNMGTLVTHHGQRSWDNNKQTSFQVEPSNKHLIFSMDYKHSQHHKGNQR